MENTLEQEQEALVNRLWIRMEKLEAEKRWLICLFNRGLRLSSLFTTININTFPAVNPITPSLRKMAKHTLKILQQMVKVGKANNYRANKLKTNRKDIIVSKRS